MQFIFLFLALSINAETESCQEFKIEGKLTRLCYHESQSAWVSEKCFLPEAKCEALKLKEVIQAKSFNISVEEASGGKNPGNILCRKAGGTVMMGTIPPKGSGQSFCQGTDKSLIDSNSLHSGLRPSQT